MITWREYIHYKKPYTNNRAEQALCWLFGNPGMIGNEQRQENSNGPEKIPMPTPMPMLTLKNTEYRYQPKIPSPTQLYCIYGWSFITGLLILITRMQETVCPVCCRQSRAHFGAQHSTPAAENARSGSTEIGGTDSDNCVTRDWIQ